MKLWADFYDYVLPDLPGVPQELAALHLRNSAIEFCDSTGIFVYQPDDINAVAGQGDYDLEPPSGNYDVARVLSAWFKSGELKPTSEDMIRKSIADWTNQVGNPSAFMHANPNVVTLIPAPSESHANALRMRLVIRPSRTGRGVEDWIFNKYVEVIASGAKYRLASMPQKPWTSQEVAMYQGRMYQAGVLAATAEASKSFTRVDMQVQLKRTL